MENRPPPTPKKPPPPKYTTLSPVPSKTFTNALLELLETYGYKTEGIRSCGIHINDQEKLRVDFKYTHKD